MQSLGKPSRIAYDAAFRHRRLVDRYRGTSEGSDKIEENYDTIKNAGDKIVKGVELPSLGEDEYKPVDPTDTGEAQCLGILAVHIRYAAGSSLSQFRLLRWLSTNRHSVSTNRRDIQLSNHVLNELRFVVFQMPIPKIHSQQYRLLRMINTKTHGSVQHNP